MAKTKKKRRRKHRGTQGGSISNRPAGRPRNRAEAKARARQRRAGGGRDRGAKGAKGATGPGGARVLQPPTWRSAFMKGGLAALLFFALFALLFNRPVGSSAGIAALMLAFYVPMSYMVDGFMYRRQQRNFARAREQQED